MRSTMIFPIPRETTPKFLRKRENRERMPHRSCAGAIPRGTPAPTPVFSSSAAWAVATQSVGASPFDDILICANSLIMQAHSAACTRLWILFAVYGAVRVLPTVRKPSCAQAELTTRAILPHRSTRSLGALRRWLVSRYRHHRWSFGILCSLHSYAYDTLCMYVCVCVLIVKGICIDDQLTM